MTDNAPTPTPTPATDDSPDPRPGIAVLCTGNSARSQMAEALLRRAVGDRTPVYSAGTEPAERIRPEAVTVMEELGHDLSGQRPKHLDELLGRVPIHTVILVCDGAAESCPTWPGAARRLLWPHEDPAALEGTEEERLAKFRAVRDQLRARIEEWLASSTTDVPAP